MRQADMQDMGIAAPQIRFNKGMPAGHRLKGERGDEFPGRGGQDDRDLGHAPRFSFEGDARRPIDAEVRVTRADL